MTSLSYEGRICAPTVCVGPVQCAPYTTCNSQTRWLLLRDTAFPHRFPPAHVLRHSNLTRVTRLVVVPFPDMHPPFDSGPVACLLLHCTTTNRPANIMVHLHSPRTSLCERRCRSAICGCCPTRRPGLSMRRHSLARRAFRLAALKVPLTRP
jgi:hypothetical protein